MKPSSRIMAIRVSQSTEFPKTDASVSTGYYKASELERTVNALIEYLDEQAKLLDTHTVKEPDGCSSKCRREGICEKCALTEEPTTPEKKCCDTWCVACEEKGIKRCIHTCSPYSHQVKLPTSSYEVTCGRCEKSIKHSCGPVKI